MAADFGDEIGAGVWSDASAAIAICQRSGLGKLRHIQTQFLWLQDRVSAKDLSLTKVVGIANPADMLTKNLARANLDRHLAFSSLKLSAGRADGSLQLRGLVANCSSVAQRALHSAANSWYMHGSSKVGIRPLRPMGGVPLGF